MIIYSTSFNNKLYIYKNKIYIKYTHSSDIDDIDLLEIIVFQQINYPKYKLIPVSKLFFKDEEIFVYYDTYITMLITNKKERFIYKFVGFVTYYPFTFMFLSILSVYAIVASYDFLMR